MGWLIGLESGFISLRRDKPTAFWATRRKASLSDSEGNHPKAQEVRGSRRKSTALKQRSEANRRFFAESLLSEQKNRRYATAHLRNSGKKNGVADRTRTDGLLGHNQTL